MKKTLTAILAVWGLLAVVACQNPVSIPSLDSAKTAAASRSLSAGFSGEVTLKAMANGKYVSLEGTSLVANAATAGATETFALELQSNGNYALKAKSTGKYVCADLGLGGKLVADRASPQGWERFTLVLQSGDNYALKAESTGKFVCAENAGASPLIADRPTAQGWETFTIQVVGDQGLSTPTGLAGVSGDKTVSLSWNAAPTATSYQLYWGTSPNVTVATGTKITTTSTSYVHTGLTNGTGYYYLITAANAEKTSAASAVVGPVFPNKGTGTSLTVSFAKKDDWGTGYTGILTIRNNGTKPVSDWKVTFDSAPLQSSWNATFSQTGSRVTVTPGVTIAAGATITDIGFVVQSSTAPTNLAVSGGEPVIPATPTGLSATPSDRTVSLGWAASTGATAYQVYWGTSADLTVANGTKVDVASPSYLHTSLTNKTAYYYLVVASNAAGSSDPTAVLGPVVPDLLPPAAPVGVSATSGNGTASLQWNSSLGAQTYTVYRSLTRGAGKAGTPLTGATSPLSQTGLVNGTTYYFVVTASNAAGESAPSAEVAVTPSAVFTWNSPAQGSVLEGLRTNGPVSSTKTGAWDGIKTSWPSMLLVNNLWGIPRNGSGTGTVFQESVGSRDVYGWAWNVVPNDRSSINVIAYQEVGWGWSPNRAQTVDAVHVSADDPTSGFFNGATPLHRINSGKRYFVDFDILRTNRSGVWNTAFDIWLSKVDKPWGGTGNSDDPAKAGRNGKNGVNQIYEIMIWFDYQTQGPWGDNPQSVTINGHKWKVYDNNGSAGWRVISYLIDQAAVNSVRDYDVSAFIDDAAARYGAPRDGYPGLTRDHFVNAIEFGSEACDGNGMLELANYKIDIR